MNEKFSIHFIREQKRKAPESEILGLSKKIKNMLTCCLPLCVLGTELRFVKSGEYKHHY